MNAITKNILKALLAAVVKEYMRNKSFYDSINY